MNTTERAIALFAIRAASATTKKAKKTFDIPLTLNKRFATKSTRNVSGLRQRFVQNKIKTPTFILPSRPVSARILLDFPLINPNKQSEPIRLGSIVPLTQPKFSSITSKSSQSVTKILSATMSAERVYILERWKKGMIDKLGTNGFAQYQKDTFERGRALHEVVANYLLGQGEPTSASKNMSNDTVVKLWDSIKKTLKDKVSNPRLVEHVVTHKDMNYRGIVDCVAFYDGKLSVVDFKTAEKKKKGIESLYDNPLQVSAYCGAINNDPGIPEHIIGTNVNTGVLIVAYVDGSEADVYFFDETVCEKYWRQWLLRLDQFQNMNETN